MFGNLRRGALPAVFCLLAGTALAQVAPPIPTPGGIAQENQRTREVIEQQATPDVSGPPVIGPKAPETFVPPPGGASFVLKKVEFDHSAFISDEELNALAAPYIGTKVDNSQLQRLLKAVNDIYAARRIITSLAFLPKQDLKKGVLKISLVEGRLGKVTVQGNHVLSAEDVVAAVAQPTDAPIDVPRLENDVAWFNKAHLAQVQAGLQSGAGFGLTDLQMTVLEPHRDILQVFTDNQGVRSVGEYEGGVNYQRYGVLGIDDKFSGYASWAKGNDNASVSYNMPLLPWGGRIGVSGSTGDIRVDYGPYKPLDIQGWSQSGAVNLTQPIFVNTNWVLLANAAVSRGDYKSRQSGVLVTDDLTNKATGGATLGYVSATLQATLAPTFSFVDSKYLVTGAQQSYQAVNAVHSASLTLPYGLSLNDGGASQWASQKLLAGDQLFQIGGPTTVRGYPTNAVAGYAGYYNNLELHRNLYEVFNGLGGFVFYDNGMVFSTFPKSVTMNSVGAGLSWDTHKYLVSELSIGIPLTRSVYNQADYAIYYRLSGKFE